MDLEKIGKLKCVMKNQKFISVSANDKNVSFILNNVNVPFGLEKFFDKEIINIELLDNNNDHNNIMSQLYSIDSKIKNKIFSSEINVRQMLTGKDFISVIKQSKLGNILRTHPTSNCESYIQKKDGEKFLVSLCNVKNTTCDVKITLKGIWIKNDTYGLYWTMSNINIKSFNNGN